MSWKENATTVKFFIGLGVFVVGLLMALTVIPGGVTIGVCLSVLGAAQLA